MTVAQMTHPVAVATAVFQAKAYCRDKNPRHLDIIEEIHQQVRSPASFLTDTVARLGRHNALAVGIEAHVIENCLRLRRERVAT